MSALIPEIWKIFFIVDVLELSKFCWISSKTEFVIITTNLLEKLLFSAVKYKIPFWVKFMDWNWLLKIDIDEDVKINKKSAFDEIFWNFVL